MHAWKLYQYIDRKVTAATHDVRQVHDATPPSPEAPASVNLRVLISGHETQITLRDTDEARLLDRVHALLKRSDLRPIPKPAPRQSQWRKGGGR